MEGMKWGAFMLYDAGHDNPEYVVIFTYAEGFSVPALTEAIEDHEDFVECAYVIDPEDDDLYKGFFPT